MHNAAAAGDQRTVMILDSGQWTGKSQVIFTTKLASYATLPNGDS